MKKILHVTEKVKVTFSVDDKTSIVEGEVISRKKDSFVIKAFKRIILSLDKKKYDVVDFTPSRIQIFRENVQNTIPINHKLNLAIEGSDDGEY